MTIRRPFLRYIATYVVVLLIPIAFFVLVFRVNLLTQLRREAEGRLALEADAAIERLQDELQQLSNISYQIGRSAEFISFRIADPLTAIDAQETLFLANFTNDLIDEIAYLPAEANVVYASNSPYAPQTYYTSVLSIDPNSQERLANAVEFADERRFLSLAGRDGEPAVFLVDPVPRAEGLRKGVLVYSISTRQLAGEVQGIRSWPNARVLLSADGEQLLRLGAEGLAPNETLTERRSIEEFGVRLDVSISERSLLAAYNRSIAILALAVGAAIVLSIPLIYVFSARHYRPVAQIEQFLERTFRVHPDERELGTMVEEQVEMLLEERRSLAGQINASSELVVRELLVKLFRGAIQPVERFQKLCDEYGIAVSHRELTVVMVAFSDNRGEAESAGIPEILSSRLGAKCYGYLEPDTGVFSLLVSNTPDASRLPLAEALETILRAPALADGGPVAIAVGSTSGDLATVSQSYVEARSALEHRHIHGMNEVFSFERIYESERSNYEYPTAKLSRLEVLVRSLQVEALPTLVDEVFAAVGEQRPSLAVARMVAFDCANTMIRAASAAVPGNQRELWELLDALSLARLQTIGHIEEHMKHMSERLAGLLASVRTTAPGDSFASVLQFIQEHAFDPDFSAHTVADYTAKSLSSFSHHFRSHMGTTFRDYLNELRMGRALELLVHSDSPVGDIVLSVGYSDATSFIRKFKREHGTTPSEFRRQARITHQDRS